MKTAFFVCVVSIGLAGTAMAAACPPVSGIAREWVEHAGERPPVNIVDSHYGFQPVIASPLLLPVHAVSYWVGVSHRASGGASPGEEPGCLVLGSAAFYDNGPEDRPRVDFVGVVKAGEERGLRERLVELRWFDPGTGKRHRWFNVKLARRLGWLSDGRGIEDETHRPIPLAAAINSLL